MKIDKIEKRNSEITIKYLAVQRLRRNNGSCNKDEIAKLFSDLMPELLIALKSGLILETSDRLFIKPQILYEMIWKQEEALA